MGPAETQTPLLRLVASGGPVTRALLLDQGDGVAAERRRLQAQRDLLRERILADAAMIETLSSRLADLARGGA